MAPSSAYVGQMPANEHDKLIVVGFWRLATKIMGPSPPGGKPSPPLIPVKEPEPRPHDSRQWQMYAQVSSVMALIVIITSTRLLLRFFKKNLRWGMDDWTIIVGASFGLAFCATRIAVTKIGGAGKHLYDATYEDFEYFLAIQSTVGYPLYILALGFTKISICLFNRRLTTLISRRWMIYHYTLITLITFFMLAFILASLFSCRPVWTSMRLSELGARNYKTHCARGEEINMAFSITHLTLDALILPVPLIILKRLHMTRWQQVRLGFLFSVGLVSILGAAMMIRVMLSKQPDMLYNYPNFNRWQMIDLTFALAVASLPTLNALLPNSLRKGASIVQEASPYGLTPSPRDRTPALSIRHHDLRTSFDKYVSKGSSNADASSSRDSAERHPSSSSSSSSRNPSRVHVDTVIDVNVREQLPEKELQRDKDEH